MILKRKLYTNNHAHFLILKMAKVQVLNVNVLDNPTLFRNSFQFEVTFECTENLETGRILINYDKSQHAPYRS